MEDAGCFGLAALGKAGDFTVEILSRPDGGWSLSFASSSWCFDFELARAGGIAELAAFLRSHAGRTGFAELVIGSFRGVAVRIIKDDEFADRFFLRAGGGGAMAEFTLVDESARDFADAVAEAATEFGTEAREAAR